MTVFVKFEYFCRLLYFIDNLAFWEVILIHKFHVIICILLNPSTPRQVEKLGSFILELSTGDSVLLYTCNVINFVFVCCKLILIYMVVGFTTTYTLQSVPVTTKVVSSNSAHSEVYSIQHYVIKFVSDLRKVGGFLRFPPLTN